MEPTLPPSSSSSQSQPPAHYLYFLVCAAASGPRAGLFKLGITSVLAARHYQHTLTWESFDLGRSALLRARTRKEVLRLENALRHIFGDAGAQDGSRAVGATHRPDGSPAPHSWRRHPGQRADGHTEFYDVRCLNLMLSFTEGWLACRQDRAEGACLQRGLESSEAAMGLGLGRSAQPSGPGEQAAQVSPVERDRAAMWSHIATKLSQVLELALAYEHGLHSVELSYWQRLRDTNGGVRLIPHCLVSLSFAGLGPARLPADPAPSIQQRSAARLAFLDRLAGICVAPGDDELFGRSPWEWRRRVVSLYEPLDAPDTLHVEVRPCLYGPTVPFYERFAALAERVTARQRRS